MRQKTPTRHKNVRDIERKTAKTVIIREFVAVYWRPRSGSERFFLDQEARDLGRLSLNLGVVMSLNE